MAFVNTRNEKRALPSRRLAILLVRAAGVSSLIWLLPGCGAEAPGSEETVDDVTEAQNPEPIGAPRCVYKWDSYRVGYGFHAK
jgi:hypothetical protein